MAKPTRRIHVELNFDGRNCYGWAPEYLSGYVLLLAASKIHENSPLRYRWTKPTYARSEIFNAKNDILNQLTKNCLMCVIFIFPENYSCVMAEEEIRFALWRYHTPWIPSHGLKPPQSNTILEDCDQTTRDAMIKRFIPFFTRGLEIWWSYGKRKWTKEGHGDNYPSPPPPPHGWSWSDRSTRFMPREIWNYTLFVMSLADLVSVGSHGWSPYYYV